LPSPTLWGAGPDRATGIRNFDQPARPGHRHHDRKLGHRPAAVPAGYAAIDDAFGWREVMYAVGADLLLLVPLILWLMRDRPADIGLAAYGETATADPVQPATTTPTGPVAAAFGALRIVAHQVGAAVAAYGTGLTRTVEGTYAPTFLTSGMLSVVAGLLSLFIGRSALSRDRPTALPSAAKT
jgi:sugar phosphate permease